MGISEVAKIWELGGQRPLTMAVWPKSHDARAGGKGLSLSVDQNSYIRMYVR